MEHESSAVDHHGSAPPSDPRRAAVLAEVDRLAELERAIQSLHAQRAELVERIRGGFAALEDEVFDKRALATGRSLRRTLVWTPEVLARRLAVAEIAGALRWSDAAAERLIAESEMLEKHLRGTRDALAAGRISYRHATVLIGQAWSLPECARGGFEDAALPAAKALTGPRFAERARRIRERMHPDSIAERVRAAREERRVVVEPARDGMAWLTAYLPAERAVAIDDRIQRIALGLNTNDEARTFAQLRADVLDDLLVEGVVPGGGPAGATDATGLGHGIRAHVSVTVPALTLLGVDEEPAVLDGYGPIDADLARHLTVTAPSLTRLLTHPETGAVLSVGRDRYEVPADLRRWLRVRDGTCRAPGCGRRASGCDIDHGHAWVDGGLTDHQNLAHLCRRHHVFKHRDRWRMRHEAGGRIRWTSPLGRDYVTEPEVVLRT